MAEDRTGRPEGDDGKSDQEGRRSDKLGQALAKLLEDDGVPVA